MTKLIDLTGQRFGRLTILSKDPVSKNGQVRWLCRCDCGNEKVIIGTSIRGGVTLSCGCLSREITSKVRTTHGHTRGSAKDSRRSTPEWQAWRAMISRCTNPNRRDNKHYLDRGITVSPRWINNFENFYADMGDRPSPQHSIDRIDVNGGYTPGNVKWSTVIEQRLNRRKFSNNTSGFPGVNKKGTKWCARINIDGNGKKTHLGYFDNLDDAIEARKQAEIKYFGRTLAN